MPLVELGNSVEAASAASSTVYSLDTLRELCGSVEAALAAQPAKSAPAAPSPLDPATVEALIRTAHGAAKLPPATRDPELLLLVLRILASGALLSDNPKQLAETAGVVLLAMQAAGPTDPLAPSATQHVSLMLLLNLSRAAPAAPAEELRPMLEELGKSDDPRVRSLSGAVLGNLAARGGLLSRLTRSSATRLQQVKPPAMLATIRRLQVGVSSAPPPRTPQNTRIPARVLDATGAEAFAASPAARTTVEAAEARLVDQGALSEHEAPVAPADASAAASAAACGGGAAAGGATSALLSGEGGAALSALRVMSQELYLSLGLAPVARATAAWGSRKAGVVLSSLGSLLQRVPPGLEWKVAAVLHSGGAARRLVAVHAAARADADRPACEAALWCLASLAHVCGGRFLELDLTKHADLVFGCLAPPTPLAERVCALAALRCAAADVRCVRLVARRVASVHERFRSKDAEEVRLACAVVANVEQYSFSRLWYARATPPRGGGLSTLSPPPPPPPPPAALYSQAVPPPEELEHALSLLPPAEKWQQSASASAASARGGAAGGAAASGAVGAGDPAAVCASREEADGAVAPEATLGADTGGGEPAGSSVGASFHSEEGGAARRIPEGWGETALIPELACALHPWIRPSLRAAAALRLARLLMGAWRRGVDDEVHRH